MEDAGNQNSAGLLAIEEDMFAVLKAAQAGTNILTKGGLERDCGPASGNNPPVR
jgi:hypothetical protein